MMIAPTHVGKGSDVTSPERYTADAAAETMAVAAKSRRRRAAPIRANVFVDTLSLKQTYCLTGYALMQELRTGMYRVHR